MLIFYLRVEIYLATLKFDKYPEIDETQMEKFSKREMLGEMTETLP